MNRILILDGAMATLRAQTGLDAAAIHRAYLDAGADIIRTETLTGPRPQAQGPRGPSDEEARRAVAVARAATDEWSRATPTRPRQVAGVISYDQSGLDGLIDGGVDLLLAETLTSTSQIEAVLVAVARRRSAPPLMLSVAVTAAGRLLSGEPLDAAIRAVQDAPLWSLGINCGTGIDGLRAPLERLAVSAKCRVSCHPAAGLPDAFGQFDEPPAATAAFLRDAALSGLVDIVGGCCGTTPATLATIARSVEGVPARML